jgi:rsbT antagonist protein RsbS
MRVPILKQADLLIASIQDSLTDADMTRFRDDLVAQVGAVRARGVIIDVTGLDTVDSFAARTLRMISQTVRLRGAKLAVVGIQPEVAFAMAQLGLILEDVKTALDLDEGMAVLRNGR